jgi:hypothetical protein
MKPAGDDGYQTAIITSEPLTHGDEWEMIPANTLVILTRPRESLTAAPTVAAAQAAPAKLAVDCQPLDFTWNDATEEFENTRPPELLRVCSPKMGVLAEPAILPLSLNQFLIGFDAGGAADATPMRTVATAAAVAAPAAQVHVELHQPGQLKQVFKRGALLSSYIPYIAAQRGMDHRYPLLAQIYQSCPAHPCSGFGFFDILNDVSCRVVIDKCKVVWMDVYLNACKYKHTELLNCAVFQ